MNWMTTEKYNMVKVDTTASWLASIDSLYLCILVYYIQNKLRPRKLIMNQRGSTRTRRRRGDQKGKGELRRNEAGQEAEKRKGKVEGMGVEE